MKKKFG